MKNNTNELIKALYLAIRDEVSANTLKDVLSKPLEEHKSIINLGQIQRAHKTEDEDLDEPVLARGKAPMGLGKK